MSRRYLTFLITFVWIVGCNESAPLERTSFASKEPSSGDLKKGSLVKGDEEDDETSSPKKKTKKVNKKEDTEEEEDESIDDKEDKVAETPEYPQLAFNGRGYTTYKLKDRLAMTMSIETRLDEKEFTTDTKTAKVECGKKSGCKQKDVDASVSRNSIGANVYQRSTPAELRNLKKDGFNAASYAIFAKSVRGRNGIVYTFDKPIPIYPWPAAKSRYEALNNGSESWTTTATADRYIPLRSNISLEEAARNGEKHERAGNARKTFSVTMVVSKQAGSSSSEIKLVFDMSISEDKSRMAYKHFPIPKTQTFTIDTTKRDVIAANMITWSNGDKSEKPEESVLDYKLCTKTTSEDVKQFSCD